MEPSGLPDWLEVELVLLPIFVMLAGVLIAEVVRSRTTDARHSLRLDLVEAAASAEVLLLEAKVDGMMGHLSAIRADFDGHAKNGIRIYEDLATMKTEIKHLNKSVDELLDALSVDTGCRPR